MYNPRNHISLLRHFREFGPEFSLFWTRTSEQISRFRFAIIFLGLCRLDHRAAFSSVYIEVASISFDDSVVSLGAICNFCCAINYFTSKEAALISLCSAQNIFQSQPELFLVDSILKQEVVDVWYLAFLYACIDEICGHNDRSTGNSTEKLLCSDHGGSCEMRTVGSILNY